MLMEHINYRIYLNSVLAEKCSKNSQFSLRSFANQLKLSPSYLSRVLNGKRKLTTEMGSQISTMLGHNNTEATYFLDLVLLETTRPDKVKASIIERIERKRSASKQRPINLDTFRIISDWYHFAILDLTKTKGFKSNLRWIARRLGVSVSEVKVAIERLVRVKLLRSKNGSYKAVNDAHVTTTHDISSVAIKKYHKQMIAKALDALDSQLVSERDITSITVSFHPAHMEKAKRLIKEFRRKMNFELDRNSGKELYQLNIQFFKLTKGKKK